MDKTNKKDNGTIVSVEEKDIESKNLFQKYLKKFEQEMVIGALNNLALEQRKTNSLLAELVKEMREQREVLVSLATNNEELLNLMNSSVQETAEAFLASAAESTNEEEGFFSITIEPPGSNKAN